MSDDKQQTFHFDKFMKDLETRERKIVENQEEMQRQEEHWQTRELLRRYREHPHNRIHVRPKK